MATITTFVTGQNNPEVTPIPAIDGIHANAMRAKNIIDFSKKSVASSDVVQVLNVPAGWFVHQVMVQVITAEGATCTASVGDGNGSSSYDASTNLNATAGTVTSGAPGTDAYLTNGGTYYNAADTIDLTMNNAASAGKIAVFALMTRLGAV